jgi:hypothetical protein
MYRHNSQALVEVLVEVLVLVLAMGCLYYRVIVFPLLLKTIVSYHMYFHHHYMVEMLHEQFCYLAIQLK